jgi:hypothetical protein
MKNLRFITLFIAASLFALQACEINAPTPSEDASTVTPQLRSSETFHYHDGQSSTAREVVVERYVNGSVSVQRRDIPISQATNLVAFVTLDSDPIPANSTAEAVYNPGSDAWFIPFGNGNAERLLSTGDEVEVHCDCSASSPRPGGLGSCSLGEVNFTSQYWECIPNNDCGGGCFVKIIFSGKQSSQPGITLKANQITLQ